jgi:hypothetical protein
VPAIACRSPSEEVEVVELTRLFTDEHGETRFELVIGDGAP